MKPRRRAPDCAGHLGDACLGRDAAGVDGHLDRRELHYLDGYAQHRAGQRDPWPKTMM